VRWQVALLCLTLILGTAQGQAIGADQPPSLPSIPEEPPRYAADAFFDNGSAVITPDQRVRIESLACVIRAIELEVVVAVGHAAADERRSLVLSQARADSVKAALTSMGIDVARIHAESKGSKQPVATNGTAEGRQKNRRVEIEIVGRSVKRGSAPKDCTPLWQRLLRAVDDDAALVISKGLVAQRIVRPGPLLKQVIADKRAGLLLRLLDKAQGIALPQVERGQIVVAGAQSGRLDLLMPLIESGMRPSNAASLTSALDAACNSPDLVRALLAWDAPVKATADQDGPLRCATQAGNLDSMELLLAAGADPNLPHGNLVLAGHRPAAVRRLIRAGADPLVELDEATAKSYDQKTLFHSYRLGSPEDVRWLLGLGLDINKPTARNSTPLSRAAAYATDDILDAMLLSGALLIESDEGLVRGAGRNPEAQLWLIRHGASVAGSLLFQLVGNYSNAPTESERLPVLRAAIAAGADVNARNHRGEHALADAIRALNAEAVAVLVGAGADLRETQPGVSALTLAKRIQVADSWAPRKAAILRTIESAERTP
jgi:ankyrin repeat protein